MSFGRDSRSRAAEKCLHSFWFVWWAILPPFRIEVSRDWRCAAMHEHPDQWSVLTEIKNYSSTQASVALNLSVGGKNLQQRSLTLAPAKRKKFRIKSDWSDGGFLQAEITPADELEADNRAAVEIPSFRPIRVGMFAGQSTFTSNLEAVLAANPYIDSRIFGAGATGADKPDVKIYAGVNPPAHPSSNSIWFVSGLLRGSQLRCAS